MISEPTVVVSAGFQEAWITALRRLADAQWELRNLIVHVKKPQLLDQRIHDQVNNFARQNAQLTPKDVAYTIFPHNLIKRQGRDSKSLFDLYNRSGGMFDRLRARKGNWGTYFRRMTYYESPRTVVNQLANVINSIRTRKTVSKAAYTIVIQKPGTETARPRGGPCLNYIAIQLDEGASLILGVLAVYRNHDFFERAYGNYWGLCNLLDFVASEVNAEPGPLTCISSHAYVSGGKTALKRFLATL